MKCETVPYVKFPVAGPRTILQDMGRLRIVAQGYDIPLTPNNHAYFYFLFLAAILVVSTGCAEESGSSESAEAPEAAEAAEETMAEASMGSVEKGMALFQDYCTGCHGDTGIGDGPIVEDLKFPPPNLRLLTSNNDGVFPEDAVYAFVDGSDIYADHGATREMPIWGNIWIEEDGQPRPPDVVKQEFDDVVAYLKTIQD